MGVFQGIGSPAGISQNELVALETEEMSDEERHNYLVQKFGSAARAEAYERATAISDPSLASEEIGQLDQKSKIVSCNEFTEDTTPSTRISKYYTVAMLSSATAYSRYQVVPHQGLGRADIICNMKHLAVNSLDMVRNKFPDMKIGSGFRSNSSTDHGRGSAADLYFYQSGSSNRQTISQLVDTAKILIYELKVPFTQFLLESSGNGTGWIHIANRRSGGNSSLRVGWSLNNGKNFHSGLPVI